MKPILFKNPKTEKESFYFQEDRSAYFYDHLHYHPEIQLMAILKGKGTLFIGDKIERFEPGDLILIGSNLPHVFRCDEEFYKREDADSHSISIYFNNEAFGDEFFKLPELYNIQQMIATASQGIRIKSDKRFEVVEKMKALGKTQGTLRLIALLDILHDITTISDCDYLCSMQYKHTNRESDHWRINAVFDYVMTNIDKKITLEDAAEIALMSPTAFSRFFKQRTKKTFINFVNEIKIGNACKLLVEKNHNISEVCYMTGFNNISNFNRQFKTITGYTPSNYLKSYRVY